MKIHNNIFDKMEHQDDGNYYAINIQLRSGSVIYLEDLKKGEKEAYLNYAKNGTDVMLLTTEQTLWRFSAGDIERIDVKVYTDALAKGAYPLMKFFFSKSRIDSQILFNLVRLFILVIIISVITSAAIAVKDGDIIAMLFDREILQHYVVLAMHWIENGFVLILAALLIINLIDLFIKPIDKFHIIEMNRTFIVGTKAFNFIISIGFILAFIIFKLLASSVVSFIS